MQTTEVSLQDKMFHEMAEKDSFNAAREFAFAYADSIDKRLVFPSVDNIDALNVFDEDLPRLGSESLDVITLLHKYGSPATVAQIGGRYFGMVNGGVIPVALATKWLTDFWDQNGVLYITSPVISRLESVVEKWLQELLGLQATTVAGFVSGSSSAIFCGLAAARYRLLERCGWDVNAKGLFNAPQLRIVTSQEIHASVVKALSLLGLGKDNIEWVPVDLQGRIISDLVPALDDRTIVILQAGNVNGGAFDDFNVICDKAEKANSWVHVDGAFGLWAAGCDHFSHLTRGIERANSLSVDAHKTLNAPYDSGIILCNDRDALVKALQATASYLLFTDNRDGMLYTSEMSRRARIVELWAIIKYLGREGINELIYGLHSMALRFAEDLREAGFGILNNVEFNQIIVTAGSDELTDQTLLLIQKTGKCWCGGAKWKEKKVIRISVCSWATTAGDIDDCVKIFKEALERCTREISSSK